MKLLYHNTKGHDPMTIAFIGDIQWTGHKERIAYHQLQNYITEAIGCNAWYIGMGDYTDFASPSNRKVLSSGLYDTAREVIKDAAEKVTLELYTDLLADTKDHWLAMLEGHHYLSLGSETTDQYLARLLSAPFAGTSALLRIQFSHGKHTGSVDLWLHHGPPRMVQDPAKYLETRVFPRWDADIYAMGHVPKVEAKLLPRIYPVYTSGVGHLHHREVRVIGTGGWAKSYVEGHLKGDYAELAMYPPASLGAPIVTIRPFWINGAWSPKIEVTL